MNIKVLRAKLNLSQKEFGQRICVTAQTVQKYESGDRNIPDSIKKLIRYEFAEYLPEQERLIATPTDSATPVNLDDLKTIEHLKLSVEEWKTKAENLQKFIDLQDKTIASLEDQVKMYKDQSGLSNGSKTA